MFAYLRSICFVLVATLVSETLVAKELNSNSNAPTNNGDAYTAIMATKFDFGETGIDGAMKAPDGFFLQGKQNQSLSQMVRLRSSFKRELRNSRSGVQSLSR